MLGSADNVTELKIFTEAACGGPPGACRGSRTFCSSSKQVRENPVERSEVRMLT